MSKQADKARIAELEAALSGFLAIVSDSTGVAGYHLNGAVAKWNEFDEVSAAEAAMFAELRSAAPPVETATALDAARNALELCAKAIENLLPGAKHIVADVGLINDALLRAAAAKTHINLVKEQAHVSSD